MHAIFFNPPLEGNYLGHQMAEVYKDQVYAPYLDGKKDLTIIDIGASGVTPYYFSQFAKSVIAIEPSKEHFEVLKEMVRFNELTNVKIVNKAVYIENSKFPLYHSTNKTMYSLNQSVSDPSMAPEEVETVTLDTLFKDENLTHVDLMKLDVEGSEVEILSSEGFQLVAPKIDLVIGEIHSWNGRNPNQIKDALVTNGFTFEIIPNGANIFIAKRK